MAREALKGLTYVGQMGSKGRQAGEAWDDITGMPLDGEKVKKARQDEMEYVEKKRCGPR